MAPGPDDDEFSADYYANQQKEKKALIEAKESASQDPELQTIIERSKKVQHDTVESSDIAVRTLRETVMVSETTKTELVRQGEELKDIKGSAERADTNVTEAYENTRQIDKYSHFLPFFRSSNKKKKKEDKALEAEQKALEKEAKKASKQMVEITAPLQPTFLQKCPIHIFRKNMETIMSEKLMRTWTKFRCICMLYGRMPCLCDKIFKIRRVTLKRFKFAPLIPIMSWNYPIKSCNDISKEHCLSLIVYI